MKHGFLFSAWAKPLPFLAVTLCLTATIVTWLGWSSFTSFRDAELKREGVTRVAQLRGAIVHLDEVLTMSARMAAVTGDLRWERRYRRFEPKLAAAIREAIQLAPEAYGGKAAQATDEANTKLVEMEIASFDLVRQNRVKDAKTILFSDEYEKQKRIYADGMARFALNLSNLTAEALQRERHRAFLRMAAGGGAIPFMIFSWIMVFRAIRKSQTTLTQNNHRLVRQAGELTELNRSLDKKVDERTSSLVEINKALQAEVTERKQAEEALAASNHALTLTTDTLRQVNSELTDFVYVASHDLREPLRKVSCFGELLQESLGGRLETDDRENLQYMIDGANRMSQMIDGLLAYSRLNTTDESGEPTDLNEIIEQLKRLELAVAIEETGATINVPLPLPRVHGDSVQLRQVLQNLIANGIKYCCEGQSPRIEIVPALTEDESVRIEVRDNGIGIPEEYRRDVFKMFKRLHSRQKFEGTGIGLAICKKILNRHGGRIGVEANEPVGTIFWFTLPAARQPAMQSEAAAVA